MGNNPASRVKRGDGEVYLMELLSSLLEGRSIEAALNRAAVDAEAKPKVIPSESLLLEIFGTTYEPSKTTDNNVQLSD